MTDEIVTEAVVVGSCLSLLELMSIEAWRNNTGGLRSKNGFVRYGKPGSADILGILPDGRFLAVECKRPKGGRVSQLQRDFIDMVNHNGGVGVIVHSTEELMEKLKERGVTTLGKYKE